MKIALTNNVNNKAELFEKIATMTRNHVFGKSVLWCTSDRLRQGCSGVGMFLYDTSEHLCFQSSSSESNF
jgi:hypothetical protein